MKVTQEMMTDKVFEHFNKYGMSKVPRFILLDNKSFDEFNKSFTPIERIKGKDQSDEKISKFHTNGIELEIFKIDVDKDLFEVVG
jgi:hypothetical protein